MASNRARLARLERDDLVGRHEELAWLMFCLDEAIAGRPRIAILSGEPGIGKSKLARTLIGEARESSVCVGIGRGSEEFSIPYMTFEELLRSLQEDLRSAGVEIERSSLPLHLLEGESAKSSEPSDPSREEHHRAHFFLEISDRIIALAAARPLLLVVDDLHWVDASSLAILNHLAFAMSDAAANRSVGILILLTTRHGEPGDSSERLRARLAREPFCESIALAGLDTLETGRLIHAAGIPHSSTQFDAAIHRATSGNPLFIEALLRELKSQDAIGYASGDAVARLDLDQLQLSSDITSAARARLAGIPPELLRIFETGALLGQRFDPEVVARVLEIDEDDVLDSALGQDDIVHSEGDELEFLHPLIRQALCERIPGKRRKRLHASIADTLIEIGAGEGAGSDWSIVHHLMAAGRQVPPATLHEYGVRAGDHACGLYGWREAGEAYLAAASAAPSNEASAPLYHKAAWCFTKNYDYGLCAENYAHALEGYRALGNTIGVAQVVADAARTSLYELPFGEMREVDSFNQCLDALPEEQSVLRGAIYARMADSYFYAGRPDRGEHYAREALECGRRSEDNALHEDACLSLAIAQQQGMHYEEAEASFREGLGASQSATDLRWENPLRVRLASVIHTLGRLDEAEAEFTRALASTRRTNDPGEEAFATAHLTALAGSRGDFAAADGHFASLIRLRARLGRRPWGPLVGVPALAYTRYLRGQLKEADDALAALSEPGRVIEQVGRSVRAMSLVYRALVQSSFDEPAMGDLEAVRSRVIRYSQRMSAGSADGTALGVVAALIELADLHDIPEAFEGPASVLSHALDAGALVCVTWPTMIPRALAVASFHLGDHDRARELFEIALAESARIGMRPELARSQLDYARFLVARGGDEEETRARSLVEAALRGFGELGMPLFYERARSLASSLGIRFAETPTDGEPEPDLGLWRRLSEGQTNERVADDLLLSRETVNTQIKELFDQLGVEGRMEAAAAALNRGVLPTSGQALPVALIVTDMAGFTPMVERLGDAEAQKLVQLHNRMLRARIRDHSGVEIAHTGDGFIASFRSVVEATGCAIDIQRHFIEYNDKLQGELAEDARLRIRVGVHAGEALREEGRLFGSVVNMTVRLCSHCEPDHIVASDSVYQQAGQARSRFKPLGPALLKGMLEEVPVYEIAWS